MKQQPCIPRGRVRRFSAITGTLALLALSGNVWAANDLATLSPNSAQTHNTRWLGHNDLQGRTTYQTTVHTYPDGRVIAFAGHFNGKMLNPMNGLMETNGTSIVDVT